MRLVVAGSRSFGTPMADLSEAANTARLESARRIVCREMSVYQTDGLIILSGTASGADRLGEWWAGLNRLPVERYPADWQQYGKRAGYLRNELMAQKCDSVIVFWDGKSRGTEHMMALAKRYGRPLTVVRV